MEDTSHQILEIFHFASTNTNTTTPPPCFYCFPCTTPTRNTLQLFSLNHHHSCVFFYIHCHHHHHHIFIVFFPLPPAPHFCCFPSTTPTGNTRQLIALNHHHHPCVKFCIDCYHPTTFLLFSLHRHHHHDQIFTGFPPRPSHYLPHIDSILAVHRPPHQPCIDPTSI